MRLWINDTAALLEKAHTERVWGWDLETNGKKAYDPNALLLTASLSPLSGESFGFILDHPLDLTTTDTEYEERIRAIQSILEDPNKVVTGHSLWTFDIPFWKFFLGYPVLAHVFDSKVAHSLVDENAENSLEYLAEKYTPYIKNEEGLNRKRLWEEDPMKVLRYNMVDSMISRHLYPVLYRMLQDEGFL